QDAGQRLPGVGAGAGAVAAPVLAGDDGGADGVFGAPVGGLYPGGGQEREQGGAFPAEVVSSLRLGGCWVLPVMRVSMAAPRRVASVAAWSAVSSPASRRSRTAKAVRRIRATACGVRAWPRSAAAIRLRQRRSR